MKDLDADAVIAAVSYRFHEYKIQFVLDPFILHQLRQILWFGVASNEYTQPTSDRMPHLILFNVKTVFTSQK